MRLPVSRRRHEKLMNNARQGIRVNGEVMVKRSRERDEARHERDEAQAALRSVRDQRDEWAEEAWQRGQKLREVRKQRNEAWARVAELEQAIRGHLTTNAGHATLREVLDRTEREQATRAPSRSASPCRFEDAVRTHYESFDGQSTDPRNERLWRVLDGHDRQEADSLPQHGVATGGNLPRRGYSSGTATPVSEWRDPKGADGDH